MIMKELSIEEKAKAYDRAFEIAKAWRKLDNNDLSNDDLETLFPELRESEDERVRKELIKIVNDHYSLFKEIDRAKTIAWLEKQGEQKVSCTTLVETGNGGINALITRELPTNGCDEQKPTQEMEPTPIFRIGDILKRKGKDYTFRVDRIQGGYYHCDRNHGAFFPIEEQGNWELVEQKPTWSEEDEGMIQALNACIDAAIKSGMNYISFDSKTILIGKVKNWLKSLRPQNTWKPSDEQMRALENFIGTIPPYERMFQILKSLYNELKKLKRD